MRGTNTVKVEGCEVKGLFGTSGTSRKLPRCNSVRLWAQTVWRNATRDILEHRAVRNQHFFDTHSPHASLCA